jgi:hypothetical protein
VQSYADELKQQACAGGLTVYDPHTQLQQAQSEQNKLVGGS